MGNSPITAASFAPRVLLLSALIATAVLQPAASAASGRIDVRAGYDTGLEGISEQYAGDSWVGMTAGRTLTSGTDGPLSLSLDVALGAVAYASLTDLDQVTLTARPGLDYVISQRVSANLSLAAEGRIVKDDGRSAWGLGADLRLRERISSRVELTEYFSWRRTEADDAAYSGTNVTGGLSLVTAVGERWTLGAGGEYGAGDFSGGGTRDPGFAGTAAGGHGRRGYGEADRQQGGEEWISGSLVLERAWSASLTSTVEYVYTRVLGGGEDLHAVIIGTSLGF